MQALSNICRGTLVDKGGDLMAELQASGFKEAKVQELIFPKNIQKLDFLTELNCSENLFIELPPEIGFLTNLEKLDLSDNKLKSLPPTIQHMTNLVRLHLYKNDLAVLPDEIASLKKLQELNVFNNKVIKIPAVLGELSSLREVNFADNKLKTIPPLDGNALDVLPEFGNFKDLDELILTKNWLSNKLESLEVLEVNQNLLKTVPASVGNLQMLWKLMLASNKIDHVPPEVFTIKLKTIDLSSNILEEFPSGLENCSNLQNLMVANNQVREHRAGQEHVTLPAAHCRTQGNPITWDGTVGQKNVVLQQELIAKFSAIPSSKFLPASQ
ncbi:hypothetical protein GUITHDRAFT_113144 [Guillardia theta CCMP2712]|uniref:Disease resistance R13L4/SHOC-2-like LRR domain-containing protein n=1 Tax=Guillardia theta (strain CCMP2712) TaxID=905079 RepID=L1IYB7_GUITC|nr:hypothetical protein GUITHDRAFT_113144 [Guillardia theta CCMP2712]EKX40884.1 hypothetical protein GUITHDRAFT_113144 [Guillardia theta CCMP2712]|eukprot:XP_005827864.1 hypothetical protein GUITHDRAFT_113144 [Guillardia theta CCMP2712]